MKNLLFKTLGSNNDFSKTQRQGERGLIGVVSGGIIRIPNLASLLGNPVRRIHRFSPVEFLQIKQIAGWGYRPSTKAALTLAKKYSIPYIALEDGFLRSFGLGVHGAQPLSLTVDDLGIYYDASRPSRLESLIGSLVMDGPLREQAGRALDLIRRHRLSKYNHAPCKALPAARSGVRRILVVDQTHGDVSVRLGGADAATFQCMLDAALAENPQSEIWVKTHPDVISGKKQGYLDRLTRQPGIHLLAEDISPLSLIEQMDKVYVVTSQMGFEALMLGKPVACFGLPWYAGWGVTDDRHPDLPDLQRRRNVRRTVEELFAAAYLQYARYIHPVSGKPGTIFDVIDWIVRNKAAHEAGAGNIYCVGMSLWKRAIVRPFLAGPLTRLHFVRSLESLRRRELPADARMLIWGVRNEQAAQALATERKLPLWRMEDGFLRSVGLGSDLHRPVSLVVDRGGMYYDPESGSDLERMLLTLELTADEKDRAARFREAFVARRMSKYNLGHAPLELPAQGRRVVLVPGQVEDDASVRRGSPQVRTNLALLEAARAANPDAYLIYKPHPDVVAGNRLGAIADEDLQRLADHCELKANIIDCILAADEVHTMTSLSGFEALLHGRRVHCHGAPFYAGWGLTLDRIALPQRQRRLSLDELVFAVFLHYPRYALPACDGLVAAEDVMTALAAQASAPIHAIHQGGIQAWSLRKLRKLRALGQLLRDEWRSRK